ncbi:hypothetical protein L3X38_013292 [Prunus dulcis]|uniref:Uncharacterized protein n=1 Tax=Prunus dulcis TaxID=3755 RepID=A0AAD4ZGU8_PRUDU|nr:hypothetical protein L3X38_013292 [Prunus dulcis]
MLVRIPQVLVADIAESLCGKRGCDVCAISWLVKRVIFEGDCLQVISAIARTDEDHFYLENISLVPGLGLLSRCTYAHAEACHVVRRVAQNDSVEEEVPNGIKSNQGGVILKRHLVRSGKRVIGSFEKCERRSGH